MPLEIRRSQSNRHAQPVAGMRRRCPVEARAPQPGPGALRPGRPDRLFVGVGREDHVGPRQLPVEGVLAGQFAGAVEQLIEAEPHCEPSGRLQEHVQDGAGDGLGLPSEQRRRGHDGESRRRDRDTHPDRSTALPTEPVRMSPEVIAEALPDGGLVVEVANARGDQQSQLRHLVATIPHRALGLGQEVLGQRALPKGVGIEVREDVLVGVQPQAHRPGRWRLRARGPLAWPIGGVIGRLPPGGCCRLRGCRTGPGRTPAHGCATRATGRARPTSTWSTRDWAGRAARVWHSASRPRTTRWSVSGPCVSVTIVCCPSW